MPCLRRCPGSGQLFAALGFEKGDFVQHDAEIFAALFQFGAMAFEFKQQGLELRVLFVRVVVEVEQFADLGEAETQALAAQRELESHAIAVAEEPVGALALRVQQAFFFIVAESTRGDAKLFCQIRYRVYCGHGAMQYNGR